VESSRALDVQTLVLFELASWIAEWSPRGILVARAYASMAADWHTLGQQSIASLPPDHSEHVDTRRSTIASSVTACMLVVHSFAFAASRPVPRTADDPPPFGPADAQIMLTHLVLAQHLRATCSEKEQAKNEEPWNHCLGISHRLLPQTSRFAAHEPDILTAAAVMAVKRPLSGSLQAKKVSVNPTLRP
jgi:hypothetical protein